MAEQTTRRWWTHITDALTVSRVVRRDRLEESLQTTRSDLELVHGINGKKPEWLSQAEDSLRQAEAALADGHFDRGWGLLHRSRELEVHSFDNIRITSEATTICSEVLSGKFTAWRRADIFRHLNQVLAFNTQTSDWLLPLRERRVWLAAAMRTRNEAYSNANEDSALVRRYQAVLLTVAVLILLGALVGSVFANPNLASGVDKWWVVLGAALSGALGGITSALQRTTRRPITRVNDRLGSLVHSLSRPIIGAIAGMTVLLAVRAGITQTNSASEQQVAYVLLLGFGAGFSERLIVRDPREDIANSSEVAAQALPTTLAATASAGGASNEAGPQDSQSSDTRPSQAGDGSQASAERISRAANGYGHVTERVTEVRW